LFLQVHGVAGVDLGLESGELGVVIDHGRDVRAKYLKQSQVML
jgi:hypothetical protein